MGKRLLIICALYGRKAANRDFWHHMQSCMVFLWFKFKGGDPDVWMHLATQKDGTLVCEYVLLYTDDSLFVSEN